MLFFYLIYLNGLIEQWGFTNFDTANQTITFLVKFNSIPAIGDAQNSLDSTGSTSGASSIFFSISGSGFVIGQPKYATRCTSYIAIGYKFSIF